MSKCRNVEPTSHEKKARQTVDKPILAFHKPGRALDNSTTRQTGWGVVYTYLLLHPCFLKCISIKPEAVSAKNLGAISEQPKNTQAERALKANEEGSFRGAGRLTSSLHYVALSEGRFWKSLVNASRGKEASSHHDRATEARGAAPRILPNFLCSAARLDSELVIVGHWLASTMASMVNNCSP